MCAQHSLFSSGSWWKLSVEERGIHIIDRGLLNELGVNPDGINPSSVRLFSMAVGGELPQLNEISKNRLIREVPLKEVGLEDGKFDNGDYLMFYGEDPDFLNWEAGQWQYRNNIYTDHSIYFISIDSGNGKRIETQESLSSGKELTSHYAVRTHELDEINILKSGRSWYGEALRSSLLTRPFEIQTPDLLDTVFVDLDMMVQSNSGATVSLLVNGDEIGSMNAQAIRDGVEFPYSLKGDEISGSFTYQGSQTPTNVFSIRLSPSTTNTGSHVAYLDRFVYTFRQNLVYRDDQFLFSGYGAQGGEHVFKIRNESDSELVIWDITDPLEPKEQEYQLDGLNILSFGQADASNSRYVITNSSSFLAPRVEGEVINQNISGLRPSDGMIITAGSFIEEARVLANFHRQYDELDVEVVTIEQVFNEFAGGMPDVTAIRNAVRYFWEENSDSFRYVLLFGDCSYDYKDRIPNNTNLVPIYQSVNSLDPVATYASDDYFGFLEDEEGNWLEGSNYVNHSLDVGVGRIPVKTVEEAQDVVNKIIQYATVSDPGDWKNRITYVVDDGDRNIHVVDAEDLTDYLNTNQGQFEINKLYLDATDQLAVGNVETAPEINDALINSLQDGTFLVNYIGHGNEVRWADETVFDQNSIDDVRNRFRLPVFLTATCEFGRFDDPVILTPGSEGVSGAERLLLNPEGGAIALLTTTRPVFAFSNFFVNAAFHNFFYRKELRLGDIIRLTKNNSLSGVRNRNFSLLGDPMLQLQYPEYDVSLSEVNSNIVGEDTLSGLSEISFSGSILDFDSAKVSSFSGEVVVTLYDQLTEKETIGQESSPFTYRERDNILFRGVFSVENGDFEGGFVLPEFKGNSVSQGQITFFAQSDDGRREASGFNNSLRFGGQETSGLVDNESPEISVYINDSTLSRKEPVGFNSVLYATIRDNTGINTSINRDRDMLLKLNDTSEYVLNNYFLARKDNPSSGIIEFPLELTVPGRYSGELIVWDLHNNFTTETVDFIVSNSPRIQIYSFTASPNPADDFVEFKLNQDRVGEPLDIRIGLFQPSGRLVHEEIFEIDNSQSNIGGLRIDLPIGTYRNGLYLFRFDVTSKKDGSSATKSGKLIISK